MFMPDRQDGTGDVLIPSFVQYNQAHNYNIQQRCNGLKPPKTVLPHEFFN
jgi:hypothetical protein